LQLNTTYHPIDNMRFNFSEYKFADPYKSYVEMCRTFGNDPGLSFLEFHDLYPIFCFDCSAQSEQLKTNGINFTLHIEKTSSLTLEAHCVLLEDAHYKIDVNDGNMIRLM